MTTASKRCNTCERVFTNEQDFLENTVRWRLCDLGNLWFNCSCGSTLMIQKGKFDWYTPTLGLSEEAQGLFNKLAKINTLPRIPATIMKMQTLLADETSEPVMIAKTLKTAPVTAAAVIKHADNLKAARDLDGAPISTIEHAVVYIGRAALRDIITAAAISKLKLPDTGYDYKTHWHKAFVAGAVGEKLTQFYAGAKEMVDEIYLGSSLANIGKLVANHCFPNQVKSMVEDIKNPKTTMTWSAAEIANEVPSHETLGEIAAALWGLPDYVSDASRWHHTKPSSNASRMKSDIAGFANQITHWLNGQPEMIDEDLLESHWKSIGMNQKQFEELVETLLPLRERAVAI